MNYLQQEIKNRTAEFCELIYFFEKISDLLCQNICDIANFLIVNNAHLAFDAYIKTGEISLIKIEDKQESSRILLYILSAFTDRRYATNRVYDFGNCEEGFGHIYIKESDFINFPPLNKVRIGEGLNAVELSPDFLIQAQQDMDTFYAKRAEEFEIQWQEILETNKKDNTAVRLNQLGKSLKQQEPIANMALLSKVHPALDPANPRHAPELITAIKAWEAKYLENQYPHDQHTPAIKKILTAQGINNTRLIDRISAITNPNKNNS